MHSHYSVITRDIHKLHVCIKLILDCINFTTLFIQLIFIFFLSFLHFSVPFSIRWWCISMEISSSSGEIDVRASIMTFHAIRKKQSRRNNSRAEFEQQIYCLHISWLDQCQSNRLLFVYILCLTGDLFDDEVQQVRQSCRGAKLLTI